MGAYSESEHSNKYGQQNSTVMVPLGPRNRTTLCNPDGTEMTTEDYLKMTNEMKLTGKPPKIDKFGFNQTVLYELQQDEEKNKTVKVKDHMFDVLNGKRLIAKYARE